MGGDCCDGADGASGRAAACNGTPARVEDLTSGAVAAGSDVSLSGVTATSQKFLVFRSSAGACLWGMFVSADVAVAAPGSGLMIVSYGEQAAAADGGLEPCAPGGDAIPDDIGAGDVLEVSGKVSTFSSTSCARTPAPQTQLRASRACPLKRIGKRTPPEPAALGLSAADRIAEGIERELLGAWGNLLVRLSGVSGRPADAGTIVGRYGVIRLNETALEVHDELYFNDLAGSGPGGSGKQPVFGTNTEFLRIDGILHLDFCRWSLHPRSKCSDLDPRSADCL
jgi:hypothetical protein